MPRTVWSGAISFGPVTVPIHVVNAREDHSIHFHQVHLEDMGRVRIRKICEIEAFVPLDSIDPIQIGDGYYLQPDGKVAAKPYTLLRKALERSSKVAVAKYAWSGRERLGLLRVRDDVIVLHAMRWSDEIRDPAELKPDEVELTDAEIAQAEQLIDRLTRDDLEGEEFTDRYTEAVEQLIEAKREHREPPAAEEPEEAPGQIVDLMAALKESVAKARKSRGDDATVQDLPRKKTTAKKAAAKKTAARKPRRSA
ncbi:non-homologous end joining protein Ku [Streptomyces sp. NBC_00328]|uniref:non-homologous end joining protein Ku n=1 Tax=Streptomyces sp. NBC_00328 TaxID=2903646 RepID=UPI002E29B11B|nr:Ku protein [Streptomyces sp. NBC_00328]